MFKFVACKYFLKPLANAPTKGGTVAHCYFYQHCSIDKFTYIRNMKYYLNIVPVKYYK